MSQCEHTQLIATLIADLQTLRDEVKTLRESASPVERYYDLPSICALLGLTLRALRHLLVEHRAALTPAVYRFDQRHKRHRMLPASDVRFLQSKRLRASLHQQAA